MIKHIIKLENGKIISLQVASETYIDKFQKDISNPLNNGYIVVDSLEGYEFQTKDKSETEEEKI